MANKIKFKRGAKADLPILETAEPAFCTDTNELYVGSDGTNVKFLNENEVAGIQQDINEKMDTQDKELDDKITVLSTDKADKNNAQLTGTATLNGKQLATTEKIDVQLQNQWVRAFGDMMAIDIVRNGNTVTVTAGIKNGVIDANTILFKLPYSNSNSNTVIYAGKSWRTAKDLWVVVKTNGDVCIKNPFIAEECILNFSFNLV